MQTLYVLVVDKAWAKLYRTGTQALNLGLVYHQALFGAADASSGEELARSLCRLLRADRQARKFDRLVMLASTPMLAALRRQYDGNWTDVLTGGIEDLPPRYTTGDIEHCVQYVMRNGAPGSNGFIPAAAAEKS
jgi:hypothetical protein